MAARRGRGPEHGDRGNQVNTRGHNENAVRLAALAGDAQVALDKVARGEADAIEGWLAYGAALNEGRSLFPGDKEFGAWLRSSNLEEDVHPADQSAAMWAAANRDEFEEARAAGKARTVRGIHAKWKEIEAAREKVAREAEAKARAEAEAQVRRDAADKAAKQAEARAADEAAARQAAKDAETDAEREAAKAKLADAINARKEAEKKAEEAKAGPVVVAPEPEPRPDPYGYAKLTDEALLDTANGLRADLDDAKKRIRTQTSEIADLKAKLKDFTGDKDEAIRRLSKQIEHLNSEMFRANDAARVKTVAARRAQDEAKALRAQLESQVIHL
jgi:hypothetical protein